MRPESVKTEKLMDRLRIEAEILRQDAVTASLGYVRSRRSSKSQLRRDTERLRGAMHLVSLVLGGIPDEEVRLEVFEAIHSAEMVLREKK